MLATDECDARVGQTLASRTYADLAALTADLPAAQPPQPARAQGEAPIPRLGRVLAVATVRAYLRSADGHPLLLRTVSIGSASR